MSAVQSLIEARVRIRSLDVDLLVNIDTERRCKGRPVLVDLLRNAGLSISTLIQRITSTPVSAQEGNVVFEKHERLLRLTEVQRRVPYSRSNLYLLIKRGAFPQPIDLGARAVAWLESEIDDWIATRIKGRTETGASHADRGPREG